VTHIGFRIFRYKIGLRHPIRISRVTISSRTGLILVLIAPSGAAGLGEIAPLPGLHTEIIPDCIRQLQDLKKKNYPDRLRGHYSSGLWNEPVPGEKLLPSVAFGLQSALLGLTASESGRTVRSLLSDNPLDEIAVNALITDQDDGRSFLKSSFRTFKIKVGRRKMDAELNWIRGLMESLPSGAQLRLDANCKWDFTTAEKFCRGLEGLPVEFIEEPLLNYRELPRLAEKVNIPIALDENLADFTREEIPEWLGAAVVKPALLPDIEPVMRLRKTGMKVVISDAFQTGVGIFMEAELAAALGQKDVAMGFDTLSRLTERIVTGGPVIERGRINLGKSAMTFGQLRTSLLEEIGI
jgi:O-succinylbenzoate synthase